MKVLIYCQYLLGVGHLFRSLRIAGALHGHDVLLLAGGPPVSLSVPEHVRLLQQPGLKADTCFRSLLPMEEGRDVDSIKRQRTAQLLTLMKEFRPDVLVLEQFPFGRGLFRFELDPCLEAVRRGVFGTVKVVCSLRDILSVRPDSCLWERKVMERLKDRFDAVLVHGDPRIIPLERTFSALQEIQSPVLYTGYVAPVHPKKAHLGFRRKLHLGANEHLVVAGLGGGRVGRELAKELVEAFSTKLLAGERLLLFLGPLADKDAVRAFDRMVRTVANVSIVPYTQHFSHYVAAADLVVGLGGYNTCMDILVAQVPALLRPLQSENEQVLRCETFASFGFCDIIRDCDRGSRHLASRIRGQLDVGPSSLKPQTVVDLQGASATARLLEDIAGGRVV